MPPRHPPTWVRPAQRGLLLVTPLLSGAAIMALELLGLRLLQPHFGASTYVWGGLLGTVMAALALGYLLGGALADRHPQPAGVFTLLLVAGLYLVGVQLGAAGLLAATEALGDVGGPLVATLVLLGPPMALLGAVSPFVIRLRGELGRLGTTAGQVFAFSTAGSIAGTFLTAFWLMPTLGTRTTLRLWIAGLLGLALIGLAVRHPRALVAALPALALLVPAPAPAPHVIYRGESAYNIVLVAEEGGTRALYLNETRSGLHSLRGPEPGTTQRYYDALLLAPALAGGSDILVLGMAAGTTIEGYRRLYPGARITGVEIDPLVVEVAREYFGLAGRPGLTVHVDDARRFLTRSRDRFDVIEVDLFAGGPEAPFHGLTREFFVAARSRLQPAGVVAVNTLALAGDDRLAGAVAATLASVFPTVLEAPFLHNRVLFAFARPTDPSLLGERLARTGPLAPGVLQHARRLARPRAASGAEILTDDLAPVELLTRAMIRQRRPE